VHSATRPEDFSLRQIQIKILRWIKDEIYGFFCNLFQFLDYKRSKQLITTTSTHGPIRSYHLVVAPSLSPTSHRRQRAARLAPPSRLGTRSSAGKGGAILPLSSGSDRIAYRVAPTHELPHSRLLLGDTIHAMGCIGTSPLAFLFPYLLLVCSDSIWTTRLCVTIYAIFCMI
jgi:hypothetical protein